MMTISLFFAREVGHIFRFGPRKKIYSAQYPFRYLSTNSDDASQRCATDFVSEFLGFVTKTRISADTREHPENIWKHLRTSGII